MKKKNWLQVILAHNTDPTKGEKYDFFARTEETLTNERFEQNCREAHKHLSDWHVADCVWIDKPPKDYCAFRYTQLANLISLKRRELDEIIKVYEILGKILSDYHRDRFVCEN